MAEMEIPPFEEACSRMQEFLLDNNGLGQPIQWVFREDVVRGRRRIFVKIPVRRSNADRARNLYEAGMRAEYGVRVKCDFVVNAQPFCYVWLPTGEDIETGCLFQKHNYLLSITDKVKVAVAVRSSLKWKILKLFDKKESGFSTEVIPSRD